MKLERLIANGERISASIARRMDGWVNTLTGLGDSTRDKVLSSSFVREPLLRPDELEALYYGDDFAERIVSALPREAMRQGYSLKVNTDADTQDEVRAMDETLRALDAAAKVQQAHIWARLFGGSALFLGLRDGADLTDPLNEQSPGELEFISVLDPRDLSVARLYEDPRDSNFGQPERYWLQRGNAMRVEVHQSRLIFFDGVLTSERERKRNGGWSHSVLQRLYRILRAVNSNFDSVAHMMTDMSQAVFKVHGLIDAIAQGDQDIFLNRMALTNMVRSVSRAVVIDAQDEDFSLVERSAFTGTGDVLDKSWLRLASAARMPVAILLGQSPAGLNATGSIDLRWWYDTIRSEQETVLQPRIERLLRLIAAEKFPSTPAEAWSIDWPSLWQSSPTEEADLRAKIAATDKTYVDGGILLPEEIAIARFGRGEWSDGYDGIDIETRRAMLESEFASTSDLDEDEEPETETEKSTPTPGTDKALPPESVLNGAQVSSLLDLLERVRSGTVPKPSAKEIMLAAFAMDPLQAERILMPIETVPADPLDDEGSEEEETPAKPPESEEDESDEDENEKASST